MTKNVFFALALTAFSAGALAEWTQVDDSEQMTSYVNLETVQRTGNIVNMWTLTDLKTEKLRNNGPTYLSTQKHSEFNCKNKMGHLLSFTVFSGHMASGIKIHEDNEPELRWRPVAGDSYTDPFWKYACEKN